MNDTPVQYTPNPTFLKFLTFYKEASFSPENVTKAETIKVNFVVSAAASLYETIRNAVEYREQHLLHRAAIERILKRLFYIQAGAPEISETLIRELIWARYLPNDSIPESKISEVSKVITKYLTLWKEIQSRHKVIKSKRRTFDFILSIASCEIEEQLFSAKKREALFDFAWHILYPHIKFTSVDFTVAEVKLLIRTALRKALLKSDTAQLSYDLFKQYFPVWNHEHPDYKLISKDFILGRKKIEEIIDSKETEKLFYYCRNNVAPFFILEETVEKNFSQLDEKIRMPSYIENLFEKVTKEKYRKIRRKLTILTTRSIIYIFLTKMVLAFIIEFPYERFIIHHTNYLNLLINLIVPPMIMFLVTLTIHVPGEKNTKAITNYLKSIMYKEVSCEVIDYKDRKPIGKTKQLIFGILYSFGFFITFGVIISFLISLHFNIISGFIFILFLTLVSFFGFMIRQQVRDIKLRKDSPSIATTITDFFAFPIIRTGSILSTNFAKINITVYLFDIFLEAPFKTIIQVLEEWFSFVKERKDEIV